jgi:hypothetical protein
MKCFASRDEDIPHAKYLLKKKINTNIVADHIGKLIHKNIPKAQNALNFLDNLMDDA